MKHFFNCLSDITIAGCPTIGHPAIYRVIIDISSITAFYLSTSATQNHWPFIRKSIRAVVSLIVTTPSPLKSAQMMQAVDSLGFIR